MMIPEIEKQLLEWGGHKTSVGFSFQLPDKRLFFVGVQFDGQVWVSDIRCRPWRNLDDIKQTLDVFGFQLKKPPEGEIMSKTCPGCGADVGGRRTNWVCGSYEMGSDNQFVQSDRCCIRVLKAEMARLRADKERQQQNIDVLIQKIIDHFGVLKRHFPEIGMQLDAAIATMKGAD